MDGTWMGGTRKEGKDQVTMTKCKCAGKYRGQGQPAYTDGSKGGGKVCGKQKKVAVWEGVIWKRTKEREEDHKSIVQMAKCSLLSAQQRAR